jgi:hypothetical protein
VILTSLRGALAASVLVATPLLAAPAAAGGPGTLTTVTGTVVDLGAHSSGDLLFCTLEGDVGRVTTAGVVTTLATAITGPFPQPLEGVAETPAGDLAVLDELGDIYTLTAGAPPAALTYSDLYVVLQPRDLVVDAAGNFVVASRTLSSGASAVAWMSADGQRWAFYLVEHDPIGLAADPLTGGLLMSDAEAGGALRRLVASDPAHGSVPLDTVSLPGFTRGARDGDIAVEADGDAWFVAQDGLWFHDRVLGTSSLISSGNGALCGVTIAASSGGVASPSGWSVYVAAGSLPTTILEFGDAGAPAAVSPPSLGDVQGPGIQRGSVFGQNIYDLAVDADGHLLLASDPYGLNPRILRMELPSLALTTVADTPDGLAGRVEGMAVDADGTIHVGTSGGSIQTVREDPLVVTTIWNDPLDVIAVGKDLVLDRSGTYHVPHRIGWGNGGLVRVNTDGSATTLSWVDDARGLSNDAWSAGLLVSQWNDPGFESAVGVYTDASGSIDPLSGFEGLNLSNGPNWGDGDTVMDVNGDVYVCAEDEFAVHRWERATGKLIRIGSGYLQHPSGLAIARSLPGSGSTTGWSLYVSEFSYLWEIPSVPGPAPHLSDLGSPPVGRFASALHPDDPAPRAIRADPATDGLLMVNAGGELHHFDPLTDTWTLLADGAQGLSGDLVALDADSSDRPVAIDSAGNLHRLDPGASYASSVLFADPGNDLDDVRGLALDGSDRAIVVERPAGAGGVAGGRLWRIDGPTLEFLGHTARGLRPAVDPLTGDAWLTQSGAPWDRSGELLRADLFASPPLFGHERLDEYVSFDVDGAGGALAFDDVGDLFVGEDGTGRVWQVDRATGTRSVLSGGYARPLGLAISPGTVGTAGLAGQSLWVLDESGLYEVGVDGWAAPAPPSSPPGLAPPAQLVTHGELTLPGTTPLVIESADHAGEIYVVLLGAVGKYPGLPLASPMNPTDPRVIPNNPNVFWQLVGVGGILPATVGLLDGAGRTPPATGITLPDDPILSSLNVFMDFAWFVFEGAAPAQVAYVGSTTQLWMGED